MVEARLLAEFRNQRVPVRRLRPAVERLRAEFGAYPLAHARTLLEVEGQELVRRVQDEIGLEPELLLVVVRNGQLMPTSGHNASPTPCSTAAASRTTPPGNWSSSARDTGSGRVEAEMLVDHLTFWQDVLGEQAQFSFTSFARTAVRERIDDTVRPALWAPRSVAEFEQAGFGRHETAGAEIELGEVRLVIDVQPLAACGLRFLSRSQHKPTPDPLPAKSWMDGSVEQKPMRSAVPADLDEADQLVVAKGTDPRERMPVQPRSPGLDLHRPFESKRVQP